MSFHGRLILFIAILVAGGVFFFSCSKPKEGKVEVTEQEFILRQDNENAYVMDARGKVKNIGEVDVLLQVVEQVGLDVEEAREVLQKRLMKTAVDEDWRHALSIGVRSVPTFAVGLTGIAGAQPYEQLAQLLEQSGAVKRS